MWLKEATCASSETLRPGKDGMQSFKLRFTQVRRGWKTQDPTNQKRILKHLHLEEAKLCLNSRTKLALE